MSSLGISVYPDLADINEIKKEMEKLWRLQKSMLSRQPYLEQ